MKKISLFILCACLCLMNGCGSKKDDNISDVSGKVMLVVGMDCENQPFAYPSDVQSEESVVLGDKYVKGFDVSFARYLVKNLQREISIVHMNQSEMQEALEEGTIDVAISALTWSDDDNVDVSSPYYEEGYAVVVLKDSKLANAKSLKDFNQAKVMTCQNAASQAITEMSGVEQLEAANSLTALQASLAEKKADAIVVSSSQADAMVKANKDFVKVSLKTEFQSKNQYVVAMEDGLKEEEEGLYQEIEMTITKLQKETKEAWMKKAQ